MRTKQFVVLGLSNFGFNLAVALSNLGHQVLAIDLNSKKIEQIKDIATQAVLADVRDKKVLSKFIADDIDAVIVGLGDKIEAATLATLYLKDLKVNRSIVEATNEDHGKILTLIGAAEIIYPERDVATKLAERLHTPNLIEHIPLTPEYSILEITTPKVFHGKTLKELQLRNKYGIEVIAVKDISLGASNLIPEADFKIYPNSALIIIGKDSNIEELRSLK